MQRCEENTIKTYSILIAEDAPVQGKKLQYVLEKLGYNVKWCLNGLDAYHELEKNPDTYSLIISDYQMPELNGLELLQQIKSNERIKNTPFILLTTVEDENIFFNSLEFGANEFLNKPFRVEELKLRVKNLILLHAYQKLVEDENVTLSSELQIKNEILEQNYFKLEKAHQELKTMQEQLIISSKMASFGTFGAGMAHEINNPLQIILTYNKKLKSILEQGSLDQEKILNINDSIYKGVTRIRKIVDHLREFARKDELNSKDKLHPVDLNALLNELKDFYGGLIFKFGIKCTEKYSDAPILVLGFKSAMEQIFLNILHNAVDAMEPQQNREIRISTHIDGNYGVVEITDNGPGIPADIQEKIFDPFFTTKDIGKGVGLGMSLVKTYIAECEGSISFRSKPGETTFIVKFPLAQITYTKEKEEKHEPCP